MKIAELKKLLRAGEWNDVEFKEGRTAVPKAAFETVSAFANTHGGRLVFGIERMLRDAGAERWDGRPFERVPFKEAFHPGSIRWYRDRFHGINAGFDPEQPDREFLYHWGYLLRDGKRYLPTRAAIMLFGSSLAVHQLIPRPALDVQFLGYAGDEPMPETRWIDRLVCEDNTGVIKFFRDGIQFWNPGDVFGDDSRLFEPGEKEARNPAIAMAMRRIAMCEQAGTGMHMMREEWQRLGHPPPVYKNDRSRKAFELFIPKLEKETDMASDLLQAMFGRTERSGTPEVTPEVKRMLSIMIGDMSREEIQEKLGLKDEKHIRQYYLQTAMRLGLIEMTIPGKPRSSRQRYRLTEKGRRVREANHDFNG
jgi:ATP-dependent DNA helicase RecG